MKLFKKRWFQVVLGILILGTMVWVVYHYGWNNSSKASPSNDTTIVIDTAAVQTTVDTSQTTHGVHNKFFKFAKNNPNTFWPSVLLLFAAISIVVYFKVAPHKNVSFWGKQLTVRNGNRPIKVYEMALLISAILSFIAAGWALISKKTVEIPVEKIIRKETPIIYKDTVTAQKLTQLQQQYNDLQNRYNKLSADCASTKTVDSIPPATPTSVLVDTVALKKQWEKEYNERKPTTEKPHTTPSPKKNRRNPCDPVVKKGRVLWGDRHNGALSN